MAETSGRYGVEAEQAVLGSILIDDSCLKQVRSLLREEDFSTAADQQIYRTICSLADSGRPYDGITVASAMGDDKAIRKYLAELYEITPTSANVAEYADIVLERSKRRSLLLALRDASDKLTDGDPLTEILPALEGTAQQIQTRAAARLIGPQDLVENFYKRRDKIDSGEKPYIRTGFKSLDKKLGGGMQNSGLYILAARPGMGKTTLALSIAEHVCKTVGAVLFVSLEMSDEQLTTRRIAAEAKYPYDELLNQTMDEQDYKRIMDATAEISKRPFYTNAAPSASVQEIEELAVSLKGLRLLVVDHFSLIRTAGRLDRVQEYTAVSNSLKRLAKRLGVPVLCLAQLNRANEQRGNKKPMLSDLRDTGAAEQDADGVIMLHRADYYDADYRIDPIMPSLMDVSIKKNRHGATGETTLSFFRQTGIFKETYIK